MRTVHPRIDSQHLVRSGAARKLHLVGMLACTLFSSSWLARGLGPPPEFDILLPNTVTYTYGVKWTVPTNLLNLGTLDPGSVFSLSTPPLSVGKLVIRGNYIQGPQGALNMQLASPTSYDRINARRAAKLAGTLNVSSLNGFEPEVGDVFTILTARRGVKGEFTTFNNPYATDTLLRFGVVYENNSVLLKFVQDSFTSLLPEGNGNSEMRAVAKALDQLSDRQPSNDLVQELITLPRSEARDALSFLLPADYSVISTAGQSIARVQSNNIEHRLNDVREGFAEYAHSGTAAADERKSESVCLRWNCKQERQ